MSTITLAPSASNEGVSSSESSVNLSFQFNDAAILIASIVVALIIIVCLLVLLYTIHKQHKLTQMSHLYHNNNEELRRSEIINWVKHDDGKFFTLSLIDVPVPDDTKESIVLKISYQCDQVGDLIGKLIITEKSTMEKSNCIIPVNHQHSSKFMIDNDKYDYENEDEGYSNNNTDNNNQDVDLDQPNKSYCHVYSRKYLKEVELRNDHLNNSKNNINSHNNNIYNDGTNFEGNYEASCGGGEYSRRNSARSGRVNNMSSNKNGIDNYFILSNKGNNNDNDYDSIKKPCYTKDNEYIDDCYNSNNDDDDINVGFSDSDEDDDGFINDYYAR